MNLRSAIVYTCELPKNAAEFAAFVIGKPDEETGEMSNGFFSDPTAFQSSSCGFVPFAVGGDYAKQFPGGYAFSFRYDEKILPGTLLRAEQKKAVEANEALVTFPLTKNEKSKIRADVYLDLISKAFAKTTVIDCYYSTSESTLIIGSTNKKLCDLVMSSLIRSIGAVEVKTLHIDGIKNSLTQKLKKFANGDKEAFDQFEVGGKCKLKDESGQSISFSMIDLEGSDSAINEALLQNMKVVELSLKADGVAFKIDDKFSFKGISFDIYQDKEGAEDNGKELSEEETFEVSAKVLLFCGIINKIKDVFHPAAEVGDND